LKLAVGTRGQAIVLKDMLEYLKAIPGTKKVVACCDVVLSKAYTTDPAWDSFDWKY
jgi:hypothetical protein